MDDFKLIQNSTLYSFNKTTIKMVGGLFQTYSALYNFNKTTIKMVGGIISIKYVITMRIISLDSAMYDNYSVYSTMSRVHWP